MSGAALEVRGVSKRYGGVAALTDVSLVAAEGEPLGLLGPNGAGKSTLLKLISGFERPDAGALVYGSRDITRMAVHRRCAHGIARTFQHAETFSTLTAFESVRVAAQLKRSSADARRHALAILDELGIDAELWPQELTPGQRGLLEVAKGLATDARLLLLDEVMAGLSAAEQDQLLDILARVVDDGVTVIMVEHNVPVITRFCSRVVVLVNGELIADGEPAAVFERSDVVAAYMGD